MSLRAERASSASRAARAAVLALWAAGLCACAGGARPGVSERLDPASGMTIASPRDPAVFARAVPRYSASQRDYVYLGPVETNRQGVREYFLWIGIASTLDRGYVAPETRAPSSLLLAHGDGWIDLRVEPWRESAPSIDAGRIFAPAIDVSAAYGARVTLDQLDRLAAEGARSLRLADGDGNTVEYLRWGSGGRWAAFLERAGVP